MRLLQYFFGIVIAQVAIFSLVLLNAGSLLNLESLLRIAIPALFIALVIAFWFSSIAKHHSKDMVSKIKEEFSSEKEKLQSNAERDKERIRKNAQRELLKETTKAHAKANFKVGASFVGVLGVGALFVMAQMMTAGLLVITAASSAMGGYYLRSRKEKHKELPSIDVSVIENNPKVLEEKNA